MAWIVKVFFQSKICREVVLIFLTVGNWHKGFDRLVKAVDDLKGKGVITSDVFGQIGHGKYKPVNFEYCKYCSPDEFLVKMKQAELLISHAGMGTIGQAIKISKAVVVVPRNSKLGEHFDDHQFVTTKHMEAEGKLLAAYEIADLPEKLSQAREFVPNNEQTSECIINAVKDFIDDLASRK